MQNKLTTVILMLPIVGCAAGLPEPHAWSGSPYANKNYSEPVIGANGTKEFEGRDFCHDMGAQARSNALWHEGAGWTFGALALASVGTGIAVAASDQPPDDPQAAKNRYKVTVTAGPL